MKIYMILLISFFIFMLAGCNKDKDVPENILNYEHTADIIKDEEPTLTKEASKYYQFKLPREGDIIVEFVIEDFGIIRAKLFPDKAPVAVEKFISLANEGHYNGISFYRIIKNFMIQIGQIDETVENGYFDDEINDELNPFRGALCMSNLGKTNSNIPQFFMIQTDDSVIKELEYLLIEGRNMMFNDYIKIHYNVELSEQLLRDYKKFGGALWLTGRHTIFGQIFDGFDVLDNIAETEVNETGIPYKEVIINEVVITEYKEVQE